MVQTVCMPAKFAAVCRKLSKSQICIVHKIGLGCLLSIPSMPIHRMLIESLVDCYNPIDNTFLIHGHVIPISTWDVYCILGLVDRGNKIQISRKQADYRLFNLYKQEGDTAITFRYLEERIPNELDEHHFARLFVLFAIGSVLAPSSKEYVGSNYLELVANVSSIHGLNWARFTLDHLLDHMALFKSRKRTGLVGNLAFLQVWYFEHFQAFGDCFHYELHEHPLIKNWNDSKVTKRARLECVRKFGAEKVVIHLNPSGSIKHLYDDDLDQETRDKYKEGNKHNFFSNEDLNEDVEKEEVNKDPMHGDQMEDEDKIKESIESMKYLFKRVPGLNLVFQSLAKLVEGSNTPTKSKCDEKQCSPSSNVKHSDRGSKSEKMEKSEEVLPCTEEDVGAETEVSSKTSDQSTDVLGVKRKIDFVTSPTLVDKVKSRANRKPSKVCLSPYTGVKPKRPPSENPNFASVEEVIKGISLTDLEIVSITYIMEELSIDPKKDLVHMEDATLNASQLKCLVTPPRDNGAEKWITSNMISCYVTMFNASEIKETKHAITPYLSQWLRGRGRKWLETGQYHWRLSHQFAQELIGSDMVFIPMNSSNTHWWLCVLYPAINEVQVLDSFNSITKNSQEVKELCNGIHSILQPILCSCDKLDSRWSNYNILNWDVVVMKNLPRQHDVCSCGIFTIKYMQYWNGRELALQFTQKNMETFRKKMAAELLVSPLNELVSIRDHVFSIQNYDWFEY